MTNSSSSGGVHLPPNDLVHIKNLYKRSAIDYSAHFVSLYITYSAWYQRAIGTTNDREAIGQLKKRFIIWDDYLQGRTMKGLDIYLGRLANLTQSEPLAANTDYWQGELANSRDWRGLIEFWHQMRCLLVHGAYVPPKYSWLAYETLDIFMLEVIQRMQHAAKAQKLDPALFLVGQPASGEKAQQVREYIHAKYIASPDIWQVDMQRV
mgnify:FL=1